MTQRFDMQTNTYTIPTEKVGEFIKRFEKIERKAAKIGGTSLGYKLGEITDQKLRITNPDGSGTDHWFRVQEVTVWGEAPIIEGWQVIAVIDHTPVLAGSPYNIVHNFVEGVSSEKYRTTENDCEHCGFDRKRKKTVIIRHEVSREQKQVGLGCLADFTGSHDPHAAARLCEYVYEAVNGWAGFGSDAEPLLDKGRFLKLVFAYARTHGWVSRGSSGPGRQATADAAIERLFHHEQAERTLASLNASEREREQAAELIRGTKDLVTSKDVEWVDAALEWVEFEADTSNDFIAKLHAALSGEGIVAKHAGIAAALYTAYDKAYGRSQREVAKDVSGHVGVEGERDELFVTVTRKSTYAKRTYSYYDSSVGVLVSFTDDAGNVLKWFTAPGRTEAKLEEGHRYRVAGTVKEHGEFKGVKETVLNRVSIREELA